MSESKFFNLSSYMLGMVGVCSALGASGCTEPNEILVIKDPTVLDPMDDTQFPGDVIRSQRPNIIFYMADDMGIGDLGAYGQTKIQTPGIDSLANNGLKFTNFYSGSTVSGPSRCCLLTGKNTGNSDIRNNSTFTFNSSLQEVHWAQLLKRKGYQTAYFGKWGFVTSTGSQGATSKGYDYFYGYMTHTEAHRHILNTSRHSYKGIWENDTYKTVEPETYAPEAFIRKAEGFLDTVSNQKPFHMFYSTALPHAELTVPQDEWTPFAFMPALNWAGASNYGPAENVNAAYASMIKRIDTDIRRIVAKLKERNMLDNTIIIVTSDNGTHEEGGYNGRNGRDKTPQNYFNSQSIYRGGKRDLYEGGVRTPMIVFWKDKIKQAKTSDHISGFWDVFPTICDLLDLKNPYSYLGTSSFLPTITGQGVQTPSINPYFEFLEGSAQMQSIRVGNWKLIRKNAASVNSTWELYNLANDPGERDNVAVANPTVVEDLKAKMKASRSMSPNAGLNFMHPDYK